MSWIAVGSTAASLIGGAISRNQANKGAQGAANAVSQIQQQMYDQTRQDLSPYRDIGASAIPLLMQLAGGDYSGFMESPDFLAARELGQSQLDHGAAARGGLFGGGHSRDTIQYGNQLAAQGLGNYRNSLMGLLQVGQQAAGQTGQFGANAANNIGNAQAGYYQQRGENNADFAAGGFGALNGLLQQYGASRPARTSSYSGLGGQASLGQTPPAFGNNYANFGNWSFG